MNFTNFYPPSEGMLAGSFEHECCGWKDGGWVAIHLSSGNESHVVEASFVYDHCGPEFCARERDVPPATGDLGYGECVECSVSVAIPIQIGEREYFGEAVVV